MTTYKGLSLLDHRVHLSRSSSTQGEGMSSHSVVGETLPAALLPAFRGEDPIAGILALEHRRGIGLPWPPEAQGHLAGSGPGRIPLASCWQRLFGESLDADQLDQPFSWRNGGGESYRARPSDLLARSALEFADHGVDDDLVLAVPDRMGDGGLQTLTDAIAAQQSRRYRGRAERGRVRLLWRSAATAIAWCERHRREFEGRGSTRVEGEPIGHLPVVSLAMDSFEVVVCEIVARRDGGKTWLLPVIDRRRRAGLLGPWGLSLLAAQAVAESGPDSPDAIWLRLVGMDSEFVRSTTLDYDALREVTAIGHTGRLRAVVGRFPALGDLLPATERGTNGASLRQRLSGYVNERVNSMTNAAKPLLGVAFTGAAGTVRLGSEQRLRDMLCGSLDGAGGATTRYLVGGDEVVSEGAAHFAWCSATGRPTYRERLQPLEFYAVGRDEEGDACHKWTPLLDVKTVEGGRPYRRSQPITGMHISAGRDALRLLLRSGMLDEPEQIREVPAPLDKALVQDAPVKLNVSVDPGQGYAKVEVISEEPGLFRRHLDWRRMTPSKQPSLKLSYIPGVWKVEPSWQRWTWGRGAARALQEGLDAGVRDSVLLSLLADWRDHLNKLPRHETDAWVTLGAIGSDGDVHGAGVQPLVESIGTALWERYGRTRDAKLRIEIVQTSAWTFRAMNPRLIEEVGKVLAGVVRSFDRRSVETPDRVRGGTRIRLTDSSAVERACGAVKPGHLTAAGHAFVEEDHIALLFQAARARFLLSADGTNNWLRALRDLVRYRQHTLAPRCVPRPVLDQLLEAIVSKLGEQTDLRRYKQLFRNSLLILTFLLKRRRYEPDFPRKTAKLERLLEQIESTRQVRQDLRSLARITLRFLRADASSGDVDEFINITRDM